MKNRNRILFLSHGGGPLPLLGDSLHQEMIDCLQQISRHINKPSAIIVISAHWEEPIPTITCAQNPSLIYDYRGFPDDAYMIQYPCPGEPSLANKIFNQLKQSGIDAALDDQRGLDHGVFVPLKIMYPEADIPCVQLSLVNTLDPSEHVQIGNALKELDDDNLLIIGSGFSFHNMRAFFSSESSESKAMNIAFEKWLMATCSTADIDENERREKLINWLQAPSARYCHPREEHLLPLHICYGAAQRASSESFKLHILNKQTSMYLWD